MITPPSLHLSTVSSETISAVPLVAGAGGSASVGAPARAGVAKGLSPGAVPIEDWLVWTYQRQQAHKVEDRIALAGSPMGHASRCSVTRVAEAAALGAVIHGGGRSAALHPDAELVHDTVMGLPPLERGLLFGYGETGEEPNWVSAGLQIDRMITARGTPTHVVDERRRPIACHFRYVVPAPVITHRRSIYRTWWLAMHMLVILLHEAGLRSVQAPRAAYSPWDGTPAPANLT